MSILKHWYNNTTAVQSPKSAQRVFVKLSNQSTNYAGLLAQVPKGAQLMCRWYHDGLVFDDPVRNEVDYRNFTDDRSLSGYDWGYKAD